MGCGALKSSWYKSLFSNAKVVADSLFSFAKGHGSLISTSTPEKAGPADINDGLRERTEEMILADPIVKRWLHGRFCSSFSRARPETVGG